MTALGRGWTSLALAGAAAGLAACGGGGDKLSKSALVKEANQICAEAQKAANAVMPPASFTDSKAAAAYFDKIVPITDKETSDLADLKPADDVKADWNAFVDSQKAANDLLNTVRDKTGSGDESGLRDLQRIPAAAQKVAAAASKVGATGCGG